MAGMSNNVTFVYGALTKVRVARADSSIIGSITFSVNINYGWRYSLLQFEGYCQQYGSMSLSYSGGLVTGGSVSAAIDISRVGIFKPTAKLILYNETTEEYKTVYAELTVIVFDPDGSSGFIERDIEASIDPRKLKGGGSIPPVPFRFSSIVRATDAGSSSVDIIAYSNFTLKYGINYEVSSNYVEGVDFTAGSVINIIIDHSTYGDIIPLIMYDQIGNSAIECIVHGSTLLTAPTDAGLYLNKTATDKLLYTAKSQVDSSALLIAIPKPIVSKLGTYSVASASTQLQALSHPSDYIAYFTYYHTDCYYFVYQTDSIHTYICEPIAIDSDYLQIVNGDVFSKTLVNSERITIDGASSFRDRDYLSLNMPFALSDNGNVGYLYFENISSTTPIRNVKLLVLGNAEILNANYYIYYDGDPYNIVPFNLGTTNNFTNIMHNLSDPVDSDYITNIQLDHDLYNIKVKVEYDNNKLLLIDTIKVILGV